ncbi:unnamed protein product [Echinostoma caproni]|uniref:Uncharacterized protein n=1 Tax=Echinostoma caproni TaxID=27848 RepID=A0A3P8L1H3_9TREM|nr:unnamed protein product [Echinostoma caproni]
MYLLEKKSGENNNRNSLKALPLTVDSLFSSNFMVTENSILTGGKDNSLFAFDPLSGRVKYNCSRDGCSRTPSTAEAEAMFNRRNAMILVYCVNHIVRAVHIPTDDTRAGFLAENLRADQARLSATVKEVNRKKTLSDFMLGPKFRLPVQLSRDPECPSRDRLVYLGQVDDEVCMQPFLSTRRPFESSASVSGGSADQRALVPWHPRSYPGEWFEDATSTPIPGAEHERTRPEAFSDWVFDSTRDLFMLLIRASELSDRTTTRLPRRDSTLSVLWDKFGHTIHLGLLICVLYLTDRLFRLFHQCGDPKQVPLLSLMS